MLSSRSNSFQLTPNATAARKVRHHSEQVLAGNLKVVFTRRAPGLGRAVDSEHSTVLPEPISRDPLALAPKSTTTDGPRSCAETVRHDEARLALHPIVEHIPRLRRYARALVSDSYTADDLVQDTLLRACDKFHLWRPGSDLRAWLFTVMHNVFINQICSARNQIEQSMEEVPVVATRATQSDALELAEVDKALRGISGELREVLLLVAVEQMTYAETATALSIPIGTVMSRLSRARDQLRRLMSGASRL